jgi:uncharacterized membrane protein
VSCLHPAGRDRESSCARIDNAGVGAESATGHDDRKVLWHCKSRAERLRHGQARDCAALAKVDRDPMEWKMVAKGTCEKLGGKLEPVKKS